MINMRSSSTVIMLRKKSRFNEKMPVNMDSFQIYVMKRPMTMRTFQGYTVFPGGLVEPQDQDIEWKQYIYNNLNNYELLPERSDYPPRYLTTSGTDRQAIAEMPYVVAAIREVFEETGILLCQSENLEKESAQTLPQHSKLQRYRQALLNKEITFLELIKTLDIHLDAQKLFYIGRRITPPPTKVVFDANFYLSIVPENTMSIPSANEVASDNWIEPSAAIKQLEQKEIICAPATIECFYSLNALEKPATSLNL